MDFHRNVKYWATDTYTYENILIANTVQSAVFAWVHGAALSLFAEKPLRIESALADVSAAPGAGVDLAVELNRVPSAAPEWLKDGKARILTTLHYTKTTFQCSSSFLIFLPFLFRSFPHWSEIYHRSITVLSSVIRSDSQVNTRSLSLCLSSSPSPKPWPLALPTIHYLLIITKIPRTKVASYSKVVSCFW